MILPGITLLLWFTGWIVLGRVRQCRSAADREFSAEQLSIVIPARNEENNLPLLLSSLAEQAVKPLEIVVVDDGSTDRTAEIARQFGARVVASQPLPEGWRGKAWACQQGAQAARGSVLLFLDADTRFEPEGLRRALAEFAALDSGALSIAPHHAVRDFYEHFSLFFNLVMFAASTAFTLLGSRVAARGLFGPFVLIRRDDYDRVGGFASVKGRILETFFFAGRLRAAGVALHCRGGRGVFNIRMYPHGWRDLVEGWTRGFASGAGETPPAMLLLLIAWMTGLMMPLVGLAIGHQPLLWSALYALGAAQVAWLMSRVGKFHPLAAVLYPAPLIFYFAIFARSFFRSRNKQKVEWKGRQIRAD